MVESVIFNNRRKYAVHQLQFNILYISDHPLENPYIISQQQAKICSSDHLNCEVSSVGAVCGVCCKLTWAMTFAL